MQINLKKNLKHVEIRAADYFFFLSYEILQLALFNSYKNQVRKSYK